ncbi:hypothetical protein CPB85DRAFT_1286921 [Mucidula mucida]|nr:hypothetical protein CPB85DRAFT_1286921 [Mucidula mucida]
MRTLAVILPSHLEHRLSIESVLTAASVEIIKERAMHLEASPYLSELFPNAPIEQMTSDKVWVYVLQSAEPVFEVEGVALSPTSSSIKSPSSSLRGSSSGLNPYFKARPLPTTTHSPDIVPRTTRAASLRLTNSSTNSPNSSNPLANNPTYHKPVGKPRQSLTKERLQETFDGVPGHKRRESIQVASTSAPKIAPRLTKAAALRLGIELPKPAPKPAPPTKTNGKTASKTNGGTPNGTPPPELHRRASSVAIAPPSIAPRSNRSATLRTQPKAPPTSFMFHGANNSSSVSNPSQSRPSSVQSMRRPASTQPTRPSLHNAFPSTTSTASSLASPASATSTEAEREIKKPNSIARPPSIAPRTNKSAALRQAKKEAEEREKERLAAKAGRRRSLMV